MEVQSFDTREALLALSLTLAGCEPLDETQPCFNLFDEEILRKLGYKDDGLRVLAEEAWRAKERGDIGYVFKMNLRLPDLVRAYRDQCEQIEKLNGTAKSLILSVLAQKESGAIMEDEMILRIACVILKTRGQYVNLWKSMIPLLRVPVEGKAKHFDTTATTSSGKTVQAKGVQRPGCQIMSLNASEKTRKTMGL